MSQVPYWGGEERYQRREKCWGEKSHKKSQGRFGKEQNEETKHLLNMS